MASKSYSPVASYAELKRVAEALDAAQTVAELRRLVNSDGPKVGYKAFCYMLGGKMTPEAMKPDEACAAAAALAQAGDAHAAQAIYRAVLAAHPDHPVAKELAG
ncbi:MAG: hypothetical protein H6666_10985 [Ardenticatenaceae bacterium]|nr:hypothetical protein [Anaerolineales bacterium]MCB8918439.1 hypothetical protein [Ardenticatenaceae bacterium]